MTEWGGEAASAAECGLGARTLGGCGVAWCGRVGGACILPPPLTRVGRAGTATT